MVKFLVIRFSSIGDIVLTSAAVRCLKEQFDGPVQIDFVTKAHYSSLVDHNPHIRKVYTIQKSTSEVIEQLKEEKYDYVLDLHHNLRSSQIKRKLTAPALTFSKLNIEKWLFVNFKWDRLPNKHIVERYLDPLSPFEVYYDEKGLDLFLPKDQRPLTSLLPRSHQEGYIAFAIGGTYETKKLPEEKIRSICQKIQRPVVLIGGKEDVEVGKKVASFVGEKVVNTCGNYSLLESAQLIQEANAVISHDTGMMHIAAAFKKPIVSVWGNTVPKFGMSPLLPQEVPSLIAEVKELPCRPCSKLGYGKCPKKHFYCMNLIDEEEIVGFIDRF